MSNFKKSDLKRFIRQILNEVLVEADRVTIAKKENITLTPPDNFQALLRRSIGISFTSKENTSLSVPGIKAPFARTPYQITYQNTESVLSGGKENEINKTTVIKKIRMGDGYVYKSFTLFEPSTSEEDSEELKEAPAAPTAPKPQTPAPTAPKPQTPAPTAPKPQTPAPAAPVQQKPAEPKPQSPAAPKKHEGKPQKVIVTTSDSFIDAKGDYKLLTEFLKALNSDEEIGL